MQGIFCLQENDDGQQLHNNRSLVNRLRKILPNTTSVNQIKFNIEGSD